MLLLRALLLWSIVSIHVVGGAVVFRRFFPRESPWFGFFVPGFAFVILLNFIEHLIAVPTLFWLLPFSTLGFIWAMASFHRSWRGLKLPVSIFLGSFAFTLTLRFIHPDISWVRDGVFDFSLMANYCMGETVPPHFIWFPQIHLSQYYAFGHYSMSVVTRLLGVDIGTGFNLAVALIGAFLCVIAAAAAWRISRRNPWITILMAISAVCASNGSTVYLWLTSPVLDPTLSICPMVGMDDPGNPNPLWHYFHPTLWSLRRELMVPGLWSWLGVYHSTFGGQLMTAIFAYCLVELFQPWRSNWSWICMAGSLFILVVTSTWGIPLLAIYIAIALIWIIWRPILPRNLRFTLIAIGLILALLSPTLSDFLTTNGQPPSDWSLPEARTQLVEFLVMWWPVALPWFVLLFVWRKLSPAIKVMLIGSPLAFIFVEVYNVGARTDWTGKTWADIYTMAWITLLPAVCVRRAWIFRGVAVVTLAYCLLALIPWSESLIKDRFMGDEGRLEGDGSERHDNILGSIITFLSPLGHKTIIQGRTDGPYADNAFVATFSGNRCYTARLYMSDVAIGGLSYGYAEKRALEVNTLYDGKCPDPLQFLLQRDISGLVIYPSDQIPQTTVDLLRKQLEPYFRYYDVHQEEKQTAGVFVLQPQMLQWPGIHSPEIPATPPVNATQPGVKDNPAPAP